MIYAQFEVTSVKLWITVDFVGIKIIYKLRISWKIKQKLGRELIYRGNYDIITRICQNELTNHTLVTVLVHTAFVHVLLQKLDVPS